MTGFLDMHLSLSRTSHADGGEAPESVIMPSKQMGAHQVLQHNEWILSKHLQSESILLIPHGINNPNWFPCICSCNVDQKQQNRTSEFLQLLVKKRVKISFFHRLSGLKTN